MQPNVLELLKEAIESKNFEKVAEAYSLMTGTQTKTSKTVTRKELAELMNLIPEEAGETTASVEQERVVPVENETEEIFDSSEELFEENEIEEVTQPPKKSFLRNLSEVEEIEDNLSSDRGNRQCSKVAFSLSPRPNKFKDNLAFAKNDTAGFDIKVRTPEFIQAKMNLQKRKPVSKVVVQCRDCRRRYKVDSELAPQRIGEEASTYQCDKCIGPRKG